MANLKTLPVELQVQILSSITSFYDRTNAARVCKLWNKIINESSTASKLQYNYRSPTGFDGEYQTQVHKLLQLYSEDYVGTSGGPGTSLRGIFFSCTIENQKTKGCFIHDTLSTDSKQSKTTSLDISSSDILNDLVRKPLSDDARGESIAWQTPQFNRPNPDSKFIRLSFDISCTFGNKPDEIYTQRLRQKITSKFNVYETTTIRELVERSRRRVKDALRRAKLQISEPYELRFEVRGYGDHEDDRFLKLSVNIYHEDEDYATGNPFNVMRAARNRLSMVEPHMPDYIL
ncbi:hypothetical protein TWF481_002314 [Arthrobotrys musiformis]|uniref:F-box domain-containing protein n=1 Tax=Arthrobotrys musiformis TaxID=47236 RepID=A0AAV9VUX9_9PEZI